MNIEDRNKKTVLVTGAYGFLGRYIAKAFGDSGFHVSGIGHGKWHEFEYSKWGIQSWYESTITVEALINLNKTFDIIVHCGGSGSVSFSYQNPYEDFQKTVQSTMSILEYIRLYSKSCHFIYASSPAVQGDLGDKKIVENDPSNPVSPYGFHKKAAEELCLSYNKSFDIKVSIIRYFSIYGIGLQKQLLWDACLKIKNSNTEVEFFGTGEETRDWIYVTDAASLVVKVIENQKDSLKIINGGTGIKTTVNDTLKLLVNLYNKNVSVKFNGFTKEGDPRFYHADTIKARELGWEPAMDLQVGLVNYVNFFKKLMND
ncbi:NAD-dependent epimerase/dehydratase family protein [Mucilaginibacter sp. E4BP6]|uniref:NAD-dependent epimerase/dehydratase family protein n=1 Tax=Mucilaginibacter sp. E4BP6 TaxID=2723089 RepID=UPI0015C854D2|nr:SDR family oxidoreductase [Mucilaginibacter sp. E4BP6]NYE67914.1 UDP-glucose 4-epimerase [Mucilaginibacter sp. E4BP6]